MNPDRAIEVLLQTAHQLADSPESQARALAEMVLGLDEWLGRGGPLPRRWSEPRATWASANATIRYRSNLYHRVK